RIGGLVETHVTVADLQEGETLVLLRQRLVDDAERGRYSARNSPQHTCSRPGHTFKNLATAGALLVIVCAHVRSPAIGCMDWIGLRADLFPDFLWRMASSWDIPLRP